MEAFPAHCDCIALANILAHQLHREDSFDRTGSHGSGSSHGINGSGSHGVNDMSMSIGFSNSNRVATQMDNAVRSVKQSQANGA